MFFSCTETEFHQLTTTQCQGKGFKDVELMANENFKLVWTVLGGTAARCTK